MFSSVGFWTALLVSAILAAGLPKEQLRLRAVLLTATSWLVLHQYAGVPAGALAIAVASAAWVLLAIRARWSLALGLAPIAALWVAGKLSGVIAIPQLGQQLSLLAFVGFSFFFVKVWTLLKDVQDPKSARPDPFITLAHLFFFPTWVCGPIHFYREFDATFRAPQFPDKAGTVDAVFRVALGLFKVNVLGPVVAPLALGTAADLPAPHLLAFQAVAYSFVIYFDFSGYSDLAVGASRLMGYKTPENFALPYVAPNIREFWQRWHMTFSRVLTNYLFVPLSRALQKPLAGKPRMIMVMAYFATFLFCGYWHGPTANFLAWGAYHATGLVVYDVFRTWAVKKKRARKGKDLLPKPFGAVAGTVLTFTFVSMGWILFTTPMTALLRAVHHTLNSALGMAS